MLMERSVTILNCQSKVLRNQITTAAAKMMVKARFKNSLALSHMCKNTFLRVGNR